MTKPLDLKLVDELDRSDEVGVLAVWDESLGAVGFVTRSEARDTGSLET